MAIEKEDAIEEEKEDAIVEEAKDDVAIEEEKEDAIEEEAKDDGDTVTNDSSAEASVQLKFISVCLQFFM